MREKSLQQSRHRSARSGGRGRRRSGGAARSRSARVLRLLPALVGVGERARARSDAARGASASVSVGLPQKSSARVDQQRRRSRGPSSTASSATRPRARGPRGSSGRGTSRCRASGRRPSRRRSAGRRAAGRPRRRARSRLGVDRRASVARSRPASVDDRRLDHARPLVERGCMRIASTTGRIAYGSASRGARARAALRAGGGVGTK